jgi:hypothetical protein
MATKPIRFVIHLAAELLRLARYQRKARINLGHGLNIKFAVVIKAMCNSPMAKEVALSFKVIQFGR